MKTVVVTRSMPCQASDFFEHLRRTKNLQFIARPYLYYQLDTKRYPVWCAGMEVNIRPSLRLFGKTINLGDHHVRVTRVDVADGIIETKEHGGKITRWDHIMKVTPLSESSCLYTDTVSIEAGRQTNLTVAFAEFFYRHRQRRWHSLIRDRLITV